MSHIYPMCGIFYLPSIDTGTRGEIVSEIPQINKRYDNDDCLKRSRVMKMHGVGSQTNFG